MKEMYLTVNVTNSSLLAVSIKMHSKTLQEMIMVLKSLPDNDNLTVNDHVCLKCMNTYKNRHQRKHCCEIINQCLKALY
jgi:hypothetical protein